MIAIAREYCQTDCALNDAILIGYKARVHTAILRFSVIYNETRLSVAADRHIEFRR